MIYDRLSFEWCIYHSCAIYCSPDFGKNRCNDVKITWYDILYAFKADKSCSTITRKLKIGTKVHLCTADILYIVSKIIWPQVHPKTPKNTLKTPQKLKFSKYVVWSLYGKVWSRRTIKFSFKKKFVLTSLVIKASRK